MHAAAKLRLTSSTPAYDVYLTKWKGLELAGGAGGESPATVRACAPQHSSTRTIAFQVWTP